MEHKCETAPPEDTTEAEVIKWLLEEDDFHDPFPVEPPEKKEPPK